MPVVARLWNPTTREPHARTGNQTRDRTPQPAGSDGGDLVGLRVAPYPCLNQRPLVAASRQKQPKAPNIRAARAGDPSQTVKVEPRAPAWGSFLYETLAGTMVRGLI